MIRFDNVSKQYGPPWRRVRALDGVTLVVEAGASLGVIGVNGAGKTTLLRMLLGYVNPSDGSVDVGGLPPREYAETNGIAYLPERVAIPPGWTVRGALEAYAMLDGLGAEMPGRVEAALARLGLEPLADRKVGALSKGNLQRLGIAQMLLSPRKLMVLDEPTDGLDPVWVAELRAIVGEWRAEDAERVVVVASHNLPEVERLTERVVVLHEGRIRAELAAAGALEERFLTLVAGWGEAA